MKNALFFIWFACLYLFRRTGRKLLSVYSSCKWPIRPN